MTTPRMNLFREIHKGIRANLAAVAERAGRTDFRDAQEVAGLRDALESALQLLQVAGNAPFPFALSRTSPDADSVTGPVKVTRSAPPRYDASSFGPQLSGQLAALGVGWYTGWVTKADPPGPVEYWQMVRTKADGLYPPPD